MMSQTLGQLERDGMVKREVRSSIPPHVDYSLTPLGIKVARPLQTLTEIIESQLDEVIASQELYDANLEQ